MTLWSSSFLNGLPSDPVEAVNRILEHLRQDYARGVPVPLLDSVFVSVLAAQLPPELRLPADRHRLPGLVLLLILYSGVADTASWRPLARHALAHLAQESVTDCFDLFQGDTSQARRQPRFLPPPGQRQDLGIVIHFDRLAQAPEMSIPHNADKLAADLVDGSCLCPSHVRRQAERKKSKKKCVRDHNLPKVWKALRSITDWKRDWREFDLRAYVAKAVVGFPISNASKPVTFKHGGFWSGMLAFQLRWFLEKANLAMYRCSCGSVASMSCDRTDCPLKSEPVDLPILGKADWIIARQNAKCLCGRLLTEDEFGKPCPTCGGREREWQDEFFKVFSLWKCPVCTLHYKEDRYFLARRCSTAICSHDGRHDECPQCQTPHHQGNSFKLDLLLLEDVNAMPHEGEGLAVITRAGDELVFRLFNSAGRQVLDTSERKILSTKQEQLARLSDEKVEQKQRLAKDIEELKCLLTKLKAALNPLWVNSGSVLCGRSDISDLVTDCIGLTRSFKVCDLKMYRGPGLSPAVVPLPTHGHKQLPPDEGIAWQELFDDPEILKGSIAEEESRKRKKRAAPEEAATDRSDDESRDDEKEGDEEQKKADKDADVEDSDGNDNTWIQGEKPSLEDVSIVPCVEEAPDHEANAGDKPPLPPRDPIEEYKADLKAALLLTASKFERSDWRHHAGQFFAADVMQALPFLYPLAGGKCKSLRPEDGAYKRLHAFLEGKRAIKNLPSTPDRLRRAWEQKDGAIVTTYLKDELGGGGPTPLT